MARGPKLQPLMLTGAEIAQLTSWRRRPKTARAIAERARIILVSATGGPNNKGASSDGVTFQTVGKWRARFGDTRLNGLLDTPQPGAPGTISNGEVERVIRKSLEERPAEGVATHWNTRAIARAADVTQTPVG